MQKYIEYDPEDDMTMVYHEDGTREGPYPDVLIESLQSYPEYPLMMAPRKVILHLYERDGDVRLLVSPLRGNRISSRMGTTTVLGLCPSVTDAADIMVYIGTRLRNWYTVIIDVSSDAIGRDRDPLQIDLQDMRPKRLTVVRNRMNENIVVILPNGTHEIVYQDAMVIGVKLRPDPSEFLGADILVIPRGMPAYLGQ